MGAEIVPYHLIDEIYDEVTREDIVLDYIDQCRAIFKKFGANPYMPDYPDSMRKYLGRKVWTDTIDNISCCEGKWSAGMFVKPVKDKAFTGKVVKSIRDLIGCGSCYENYEVLVSEPIDIMAEWRCFLRYDRIMDVRPYGSISNMDYDGYMYHYDCSVLNDMMRDFVSWRERPYGCSMDICVTREGRTLLVEFNEAYALGCYGLYSINYAKLISARWSQILEREDEYKF